MKEGRRYSTAAALVVVALTAVASTRADDELPSLIANLKDGNAAVRHVATSRLADLGPAAVDAVTELIEALNDEDTVVRYYAAVCLGNLAGNQLAKWAQAAEPALLKCLSDDQWIVARKASIALGRINPHLLLSSIREGKVNPDALPKRKHRSTFRADEMALSLVPLLFDSDASQRNLADTSFQELGADTALAAELAAALQGKYLPAAAAELLDRVGVEDVYAPLVVHKFFASSERVVRLATLQAVARLGMCDATALRFVVAAIRDESPELANAARKAIRQLSSSDSIVNRFLLVELQEKNETRLLPALSAVEQIGPECQGALASSLDLLHHKNAEIVLAALSAVRSIDCCGEESAPRVADLLVSPKRRVRLKAMGVLADFGVASQQALPALHTAAGGCDVEFSAAAKRAISRIEAAAKDRRAVDISFDDLKFERSRMKFDRFQLPEAIRRLNGKRIRIKGYIVPSFEQHVTTFILISDNMHSTFEQPLCDRILVRMRKGKEVDFETWPIVVAGKFSICEYRHPDSDELLLVYQLCCAEEPASE